MEQFDQLLTCAICLDRYRNPKLLPCQHSFCVEPCMEGLVDYVRRQVKCPECRAEHRIPYQGIQAFPTNVTLVRFLELHIDLTGELPDPTAGQIMERCGVCSEKAYLVLCAHCEKKLCGECKESHLDVLKREIGRLGAQVRRVLHRLEDSLALASKNEMLIQQNCLSVIEEIDDIYRRLVKALKDRSEYMKHEVERYLQTELKSLSLFKYNLEQEVGNIASNCELVDKYISPESSTSTHWEDCELLDTKDIFLKTMEFIRNFEYETGDYGRRVRFLMNQDPNTLQVTLATYGDLHMPPSNPLASYSNNSHALTHSAHAPTGTSGLARSKSDHRLTTQFRGNDYEDTSGRAGSPGRKFGERRNGASHYDAELETSSGGEKKPRFKSRFVRSLQEREWEESGEGRRERVLDTEEVARGPLSGLVRLLDSPRVVQRVKETDLAPKVAKIAPTPPIPHPTPTPAPPPVSAPWRSTSRQLSEEDEIAKQKRANKETATVPKPTPKRQTSTEPKTALQRPPIVEREVESGGGSEVGIETVARLPRRLSPERFPTNKNRSESSDSGTSESSGASAKTGAVFSMDEVRSRFLSKVSTVEPPLVKSQIPNSAQNLSGHTPAKLGGATTTPNPISSNVATNSSTKFSGKIGAKDVAKVESESESSEEDTESSSSSESEEEEQKTTVETKAEKMEKSDIGPLLARSANERGTAASYSSKKDSPPTTVASYRRNREAASRITSPPERETPYSSTSANPTANSGYSSSRYSRPSTTTSAPDYSSSALRRSRSTVYSSPPEEPPTRYTPSSLTSKYLNRSRHTFDDDSSSSRYGNTPTYSRNTSSYRSEEGGEGRRNPDSSITERRSGDFGLRDKKKSGDGQLSKGKGIGDSILAKSRSTHELSLGGFEGSEEGRREGKRRKKLGGVSRGSEEGSESESLSSWARYLKNKYGKGEKGKGLERGASLDSAPSSSRGSVSRQHSFTSHPYSKKSGVQFKFGSRGSEPGKLTWPRGICVSDDLDGVTRIIVADSTNHRICVFDEGGNFIKEFGSYGSGDGEFDCPGAVWVNRIGQFIVSDRYNHRIQVFDPSGRFLRAFGSQGEAPGKFSYPLGVTTDALNFIYVCEESRVQVFQSDGTFVGKFGSMGTKIGELSHPHYIAVTSTNKVIVSDTNNSRIQIFDVNGKVLSCFGQEGTEEGSFKSPRGFAVDESGYIVVGDSGNNRIQIFSPDGIFIKAIGSWGDSEFKGLEGLACANGNIYAVDRVNHSVSVL